MNIVDAQNTLTFLDGMIKAKKEQVENEPKEKMWKQELFFLEATKEIIEMDLEVFDK